jgi:hypothetical protein
MSRRAHATPQTVIEINHEALESDTQALNVLSVEANKVIQTYGLQTANAGVLTLEIRAYQQAAVDALFQIGARLLLLNKMLMHGEWISTIESLGMNIKTAQRIVQATVKYTGDGKQRTDKLLSMGKTKLLELMVLDDEDIDILDQGGKVGELDLDEISRMSTSELRKALREARMNEEAKQSLIESKDQKINDLDIKLKSAKKFKPSPDSEAQTLAEQAQLDELGSATREIELGMARLMVVINDVIGSGAGEAIQGRAYQSIQYIHKRLQETAAENGIPLGDDQGDGTPAWLR